MCLSTTTAASAASLAIIIDTEHFHCPVIIIFDWPVATTTASPLKCSLHCTVPPVFAVKCYCRKWSQSMRVIVAFILVEDGFCRCITVSQSPPVQCCYIVLMLMNFNYSPGALSSLFWYR